MLTCQRCDTKDSLEVQAGALMEETRAILSWTEGKGFDTEHIEFGEYVRQYTPDYNRITCRGCNHTGPITDFVATPKWTVHEVTSWEVRHADGSVYNGYIGQEEAQEEADRLNAGNE